MRSAVAVERLPRDPVRERSSAGLPRHSLRQGWRISCGERFPVTVTRSVPEAPAGTLRPFDWNGHLAAEYGGAA